MSGIPNLFGPFFAAVRENFGELAHEWLGAKVELVKKIKDQIAIETDPKKLAELNELLSDCLLSEADIDAVEAKLEKLLALRDKYISQMMDFPKKPS
jgi:molybdopterin converting factor small subunit